MKTLRAILISLLLPVIAVLTGCGENGGGEDEAMTTAPPTTESGEYPRLVREWIGADGLKQSDSASSIAYNPKTRELIEELFTKMEWDNHQAEPSVTMELDTERSLEFRPDPDTSNDQQEFLAIWTQPGSTIEGATVAIMMRSPRLPSMEDALELLHLFAKNEGDIHSAVEWEE